MKNGVIGNLADPTAGNSEVAENPTFREKPKNFYLIGHTESGTSVELI
jgi:hypothetical protein